MDGISIAVYDGERKDGKRKWIVFWKRLELVRGEECMGLYIGPSIASIFKGY